VNSVLGKRFG